VKSEARKRRRRYFARLFWVVVAAAMFGAFIDSRGWKPSSVFLMTLGLIIALGVFVDWLADTTDAAITEKTKGAMTRNEVVEEIDRWAERVGIIPGSPTAPPPSIEVARPEPAPPPSADTERASIVYPRVWDFECYVLRQHIEGLLIARGLPLKSDPPKEDSGRSANARQEILETDQVKIEEYANRVRLHVWRLGAAGNSPYSQYKWHDLDRDIYTWFDIFSETEFPVWEVAFALDGEKAKDCKLKLTLSGEEARRSSEERRSSGEMSRHLQLTLWIEQPSRKNVFGPPTNDGEYLHENPDDILFRVPLEPDLLGRHEANEYDEPGKICFGSGSWARVRWAHRAVPVGDGASWGGWWLTLSEFTRETD